MEPTSTTPPVSGESTQTPEAGKPAQPVQPVKQESGSTLGTGTPGTITLAVVSAGIVGLALLVFARRRKHPAT